jgi:arylsulfatase A-like enzyme
VIAVSVMASVAVAQLAKDGNSRPITAIASSLADRLFTRTGPDARAQEPTRARVELTTAELDMVASVGLPAYPRRPAGAGLRELPPKIVLITVESLARNLVRKFHVPGPGFTMPDWATPNLDRLAGGRAVSFNAHGTTMMPTQPGLYTTLLSRSVLHDHEVAPKDHRPLAEVLKESGYEASFFQGAEITYGRISYYSPKIFRHEFSKGFHEIVSSGFSGDHSWGWGLHDDVVFDAAWQFLARDLKKRQFVHILTVDTHPPFGSEQEFADAPAGFRRADPMVRALYATDRAIGRLMDRMESSGLIANGALVIVTADHSPSHMYSQYMPENPRMLNDLIPLFVWHRDLDPAAIPAAVTSRMSSQVDVAPTVLELSGLEIPRSYAGRNLFDPATTPLWVSNEDPIGNKAQVVELNMPDRKIRVPTVGPVVKGTSPGDPHTDTDVALVSALQKWFVFKHQESKGESRVVGVQPEVRRREAVVREYPGGVRIVRPANGVYLPRIDELWAGGPIVFDGRQRQGVVVRVTSSIFVDLPPGTRHLKCQLGVIPSREKIHASPGQFEWHVMAKGKKISVVQMPVDRDAVRDLKVSVPAGVQRLEIKFMRVGTGDRKIGYDEGYIGEIQAVR